MTTPPDPKALRSAMERRRRYSDYDGWLGEDFDTLKDALVYFADLSRALLVASDVTDTVVYATAVGCLSALQPLDGGEPLGLTAACTDQTRTTDPEDGRS